MNKRELKYRVWDSILKEWRNSSQLVLRPDGKVTDGSISIKEPVQQFTGLKDSEGKEIFEGDIIRGKFLDTDYNHLKTINAEVVWVERYASFNIGIEEWRYSGEPVTIIGNIFENSELLKQ